MSPGEAGIDEAHGVPSARATAATRSCRCRRHPSASPGSPDHLRARSAGRDPGAPSAVRPPRAHRDGRTVTASLAGLGRDHDGAGRGRDRSWDQVAVDGEPSPELVDAAVASRRANPPDVVVGHRRRQRARCREGDRRPAPIGNGRALDHLEGVGRGIAYSGPATPFVAVPTTAGTGSEATKNAVLSGSLAVASDGISNGPHGLPRRRGRATRSRSATSGSWP